jgi:RAD51-like protein 2
MSTRDLSTLPIAPHLRSRLVARGFSCVGDVLDLGVTNLRTSLQITAAEARAIVRACANQYTPSADGTSASDFLKRRTVHVPISTLCHSLDMLLGGGIASGSITEFCGAPGVGKTQLAMQIAADAVIPKELGGTAGEALFVDTEGSFTRERMAQIASAMTVSCRRRSAHLQSSSNLSALRTDLQDERKESSRNQTQCCSLTEELVLERVHYCRVHDMTEQLAVILTLSQFLSKHPQCRVVIIDSIAFHFRHDFADQLGQRARLLQSMAQKLAECADRFGVAVVLMNQVTTRVKPSSTTSPTEKVSNSNGNGNGNSSNSKTEAAELVPALGESWGHACTHRVLLGLGADGRRYASVYKSPSLPPNRVCFAVTQDGVRDDELGFMGMDELSTCNDSHASSSSGDELDAYPY